MLTGPLEPTNEPYAIAKIAGIKMVEAYRSQYGADFINVMPTNLYGRGDNYHPEYSHVVAALIRRFHEAKVSGAEEVVVWGTGTPRREFLYVDDLADACIHLMKTYSGDELVNIGTGEDITIAEFARVVAATVGYTGEISFDTSRPDGTPRKLLDVSRLAKLGWRATHLARGGHQARLSGVSSARRSDAVRPSASGLKNICRLRDAPRIGCAHPGGRKSRQCVGGSMMKFQRRQFLQLAAGAAALPLTSGIASAQAYPSRPVRLVIGYTPGGSADLTARLMGQWLSEKLGQSFVIENRPGGGTNIATEQALRATPDGYTLLLVAPANAINATLYDKLQFRFHARRWSRSRASFAFPTSWWCIPRCRSSRSPN